MTDINFIGFSLVLGSMLFGCQANESATSLQIKPNIIYILADDLGYGDLGCYSQEMIKTPNLDKMAAEGMRFTQHYAGSTVCAPSRCALMTGYHTGHATIRGNKRVPLSSQDTTIASVLQNAGYQTGLIGKWGLGETGSEGTPNQQGFDFFYGYQNQTRAHNYYPDYLWRNNEKEMLPNEVVYEEKGYAKGIGSAASKKVTYSHDLFTQESLDFIEHAQSEPFFLYLAYTIPHTNNQHKLVSDHGQEVPDLGIYENENWSEVQKSTAAMISRMDRDIGSIIEKIKELGLDQRTVVFFSSDNGPHSEGRNDPHFFDSNGPFQGIKRDLTEGGIRVPFIVRWPGTITPGTVSSTPSAFWDFFPTACDIATITAPNDIDGTSLLPTLMGSGDIQHDRPLYWEFHEQDGKQAILQHPWKGIKVGVKSNPDTILMVYNLDQDPGETEDVGKIHPEIKANLAKLLQQSRTKSEEFLFPWEE
ncbi:MAG: arylsulfatase [Saprospiraceae bacterium]|nr:arylsulfatase [Saprospiraceae bacterium]